MSTPESPHAEVDHLESPPLEQPEPAEPAAAAGLPADDPLPDGDGDGLAEGAAPAPDPLLARLDRLESRVAESHRLIERQTDVAARLHAENQELRAGELRRAQQSLVFGVLRVFDDVRQMAAITEDEAGGRDLALVADALADALARNGVEPVAVEPGDAFDPKRHKIARVASHPDAEQDRTVAEVVRPGFAWSDGELIRTSDVVVHKHVPAVGDPTA